MPRIKIDLPGTFSFSTNISIRITDLNYGEHVGNDTILSLIHEARMQFLIHLGYTEMKFAGAGMIMSDVSIEFKNELFYGDIVTISVSVGEITKVGFELFYKLERKDQETLKLVAIAKTGMVCYNYDLKKVVSIPPEAKSRLETLPSI
jgi:acyl-CoA thioester hydrolase